MFTSCNTVKPAALGTNVPPAILDVVAPLQALDGAPRGNGSQSYNLRPYPSRSVISLSLARTQRILELHLRIARKLRALPEADWQRAQNLAIARRAELTREIHELEVLIIKAPRFSTFWELKNKLRAATDALRLFDQNMQGADTPSMHETNFDCCHG